MSQDANTQGSTGSKLRRYIKLTALGLLVLFAIAPVILAALPINTSNQTFSIWNTGYDGYSIVREDLVATQVNGVQKYQPMNIISNLNVLNRFNGSGALVIAGPSANYDLTETIAIVLYLLRGGSVIIANDFGTGNQILDPIFNAFTNMDKFSKEAKNLGFDVPSASQIFSQGSSPSNTSSSDSGSIDPSQYLQGGSSDVASSISNSFMTDLIGKVITRFAFNTSAVLMDVGSNTKSPIRPLITEIDHTDLQFGNDKFTYTQGVNRIQMEEASSISVQVKTHPTENTTVLRWQPFQKISTSLITGGTGGTEFSLPFFPMYSSQNSWLETDKKAAEDGTAQPDVGEWGNAKFALGLTIPLFPGFGKLVFLCDPSMFINRWISDVTSNDNLILFRNLIDMATYTQTVTTDPNTGAVNSIPIIFDFGHTYQGLTSPALYSTALMKLIAQMSMFPFYAPLVPLAAYGYGKKLMPENRRLRPILLTKKRGEKGHSEFERKLEDIKLSDGYGEPILHLTNRLVREVQSDQRFTGSFAKNPKEMAQFFADNFPGYFSRRELQSQLSIIFRIAENPTRRITQFIAKRHLQLLKKLIDLMS